MKKLVLLTMLMVTGVTMFAQSNVSGGRMERNGRELKDVEIREWDNLATENRAWVQMFRSDYHDTTYYQLGIKGDTTVDGMEYKKLIECSQLGFPIEGQCVGGIRTDGDGKYYFVLLPPSLPAIGRMEICIENQAGEVLLYDFSLSEWDDWEVPCPEAGNDVVVGVDEEAFGGVTRKVLRFDEGYRWIEGVGCDEGLMFPVSLAVLLSGVSYRTVEVLQDGESIYKDPDFEGVDYNSINEQLNPGRVVSIFPNPTRKAVTVSNLKVAEANVYDAQGQLLKTVRSTNEISLEGLPQGVYTLRIADEKGFVVTRKVVKE